MTKSLLIEFHAWRGFAKSRDLFSVGLVIGFLTLYVAKESISEMIATLKEKLEKAQRLLGGKS